MSWMRSQLRVVQKWAGRLHAWWFEHRKDTIDHNDAGGMGLGGS